MFARIVRVFLITTLLTLCSSPKLSYAYHHLQTSEIIAGNNKFGHREISKNIKDTDDNKNLTYYYAEDGNDQSSNAANNLPIILSEKLVDSSNHNNDSSSSSSSNNNNNKNNNKVTDKDEEMSPVDDDKDDYEQATVPLNGVYTECLLQLSLPCMQRKFLIFLDRLGRLRSFGLLGGFLSVVRVKKETGPVLKEADLEARLNPNDAQSVLSTLTEITMERFLHSHVFRIALPFGMTASLAGNSRSIPGDTIDINIARSFDYSAGRGKGDKKMKKFFHMMVTGLMGKMAFLGPFMVLLIKLKALKALILSKIALILSLLQLFKSKKGGGQGGKEVIIVHDSHGGGGHESYSGGGGGGGWSSGGGGWSGGNAGWISGGHGDSYSSGIHSGGGDSTYIGGGGDYAGHGGGGWSAGGGGAAHGWARKSSNDPQLVAYRAYIPETDDE